MMAGQPVTTHWDVTQNMTDEAWRRMIGVHLDGTFFCTRAALRLMSRQNRGSIVNMSSVAALMGLATVPHYSAAKGAILVVHARGGAGGRAAAASGSTRSARATSTRR